MRKHFNIRVTGIVQGVFFRASTRTHAIALNVHGFARNEKDGSVYIEAEGDEENVMQFIAWCERGPERAVVEKIETEEGGMKDFSSFEVYRGIY